MSKRIAIHKYPECKCSNQLNEKLPWILEKCGDFETDLGLNAPKQVEPVKPTLQKSPSKKGLQTKVKELSLEEKIQKVIGSPIDESVKTIFRWGVDQNQLKIVFENAILVTEEKKKLTEKKVISDQRRKTVVKKSSDELAGV